MSVNTSLTPWEKARTRYVIWTIVSINRFFDTYYTALQYAASEASTMIDSLTNLIDPIKKPSMTLIYVLSALAVALCFLGLPAVLDGVAATVASATVGVVSKEVQQGLTNTAQTFLLATMSAPGFARSMWPQGNTNSQIYQEAQLETILAQARDQIGDTIDSGLKVLMADAAEFTLFAGLGRYSGQIQLSVPQETDYLSLSLKTLMTGESLLQNRWFANASPSPAYYHQYSLDKWSTCSNAGSGIWDCQGQGYYFSESTGRQYALKNKKSGKKNSVNILQQIASNGWADMNVLFDGAYNCTASGLAGGPPIHVDTNGTIDMTCISPLPIYTEDAENGYGCPAPLLNGKCPFGEWE
ncbi:hypothetical protein ACLMJK_004326 [Lecanora helva]